MNIYPDNKQDDLKRMEDNKIISSLIFGNRFRADQSLFEYLIEFLLVFVSPKKDDFSSGKFKFHNPELDNYCYYAEPRMGLRRFVFYDKSKKDGTIPADKDAYLKIRDIIKENTEGFKESELDDVVDGIQDLFQGYAVILKKRNWCAQQLLPICPEFVCCEAMPNEKERRKNVKWSYTNMEPNIDTKFEFTQRNFLARGGELYYLHILHALKNNPTKQELLETLLNDMVVVQCEKISKLAKAIDNNWIKQNNFEPFERYQKLSLSFIPDNAYVDVEEYSLNELINYLSCKLHPINRIEILAKGIMFQVMRMMKSAIYKSLGIESKKIIIDMKGCSTDTIKKMSAMSLKSIENDFMTAINKKAKEVSDDEDEVLKLIQDAKKNSYDIFKSKGKEIQCIIPPSGSFERFTLSEDIIRFLVLSLIRPEEKMTIDMFLNELYIHYGIIIGPEQYKQAYDSDNSLTSSFIENQIAFQNFLKNTGFLRELSDATSIVENPYYSIEKEE